MLVSKPIVVVVWIMLLTAVCSAESLHIVPAPPQEPVTGGDTLTIDLVFYNTSDSAIIRELPSTVPCEIVIGDSISTTSAEVIAAKENPTVVVPADAFVRRQLRVTLPIYASEMVQLRFGALGILTISVEKAPPERWIGHQVPLDKGPSMLQSFLNNFSVYEPVYFLLGVYPGLEQSRLQFSFQYRLFNPEGRLAKKQPWMSGFYLAYTQRGLWNLDEESEPFTDINFLPEIFYLWPKIDLQMDRVAAFGLQSGVQHYSNGKAGDESRSTNFLYAEPILGLYLFGPYHLKIAPRLFFYLNNDDDTNPDLSDYMGYCDLKMGIANPDGLALDSHLWWAKQGASVQVDVTYAFTRLFGKNLNFYLQGQYFNGYGETFLFYNERNEAFRLGLAVVR
jgi:outer membrane phospholipase A